MTRVPHISRLFREMWEITELPCPLSVLYQGTTLVVP